MDLLSLSKQLNRPVDGQAILIYGDPNTGKTELAATIAKVPEITEVNYFGLDNGHETLYTMLREGRLNESEASKIKVFKIIDTPDLPLGYETVFKALGSGGKAVSICVDHGRVQCSKCTTDKKDFEEYSLTKQTPNTATIIDTGSQLADSFMSYLCKDKPDNYKPGWDEYGLHGRRMTEVLSTIQAGKTNWVFVTQAIGVNVVPGTVDQVAKAEDAVTVERTYPLVGSQAFCMKVAKYFGQKIFTEIKLKQYKAGSSVTYRDRTVLGSRTGWKIEDEKQLSLHLLWERMKEQRKTK